MLDTTILIDSLRGVEDALHVISGELESSHTLFYSVISRVEIYAGIRSNEVSATEGFLVSLWEIGINREIAQAAGDYMRAFQRSHGLEIADALIAGTALVLGVRLVTLNDRHFPMDDIEVYVPYSAPDRTDV